MRIQVSEGCLYASHARVAAPIDRRENVHVTDEPGDELVFRTMVHRLRIAGLDDPALRHHGDAITGLEGFRLVVSDVDRRQSEAMHQVAHLGAEPDLKLEVQVAQRLVHQQDAGLEGQCPRQRHPLLLAAAQRDDRPFRQGIEAEHLEHLADADPHRVSFHLQAAAAEGKGDVFEHVHVRPDGV